MACYLPADNIITMSLQYRPSALKAEVSWFPSGFETYSICLSLNKLWTCLSEIKAVVFLTDFLERDNTLAWLLCLF